MLLSKKIDKSSMTALQVDDVIVIGKNHKVTAYRGLAVLNFENFDTEKRILRPKDSVDSFFADGAGIDAMYILCIILSVLNLNAEKTQSEQANEGEKAYVLTKR